MKSLFCLMAVLFGACASPPATIHHLAEGALGPYSGAVEAGDLVFLSGKIGPRDVDFAAQAAGAIDRVAAELEGLDMDLGNLVSVTVYLTDMGRYAEFNEIYAAKLPAPYPARACIAVRALPAGAEVEVQGVARR